MALNYRVAPRRNPRDKDALPKYYIVSSSLGLYDFEKLIVEAAEETTLNPDELRLGVNLIFKKMLDRMMDGYNTKLPSLGIAGLKAHSKGSDTYDEVSVAGNLIGIEPYFTFSKEVRAKVSKTKLRKKE